MAGIDSFAVLCLHCDGADTSTTFTDSSPAAHSMTANGNAQVDTAQSKFGGASLLLDGTGDYLSTGDSADWNFTGDFTIDLWVRFNSVAANATFASQGSDANNRWAFRYANSGNMVFVVTSASSNIVLVQNAWSPSTNTWYHVALIRTGNTYRMFVDGSQIGSDASDTDAHPDFTGSLLIGERAAGGDDLNGWMDEIRISKGIARWTTNFTPPSAAYSADKALPYRPRVLESSLLRR